MPFTYQAQIDELASQGVTCPPADAVAVNLTGWRFVWSPLCQRSTVPVALKNPRRVLNAADPIKCSAWALSVYLSEPECRTAFAGFQNSFPNFKKNAGDHIASISISSSDGLCTPANPRNGHFDFHPLSHVDVVTKMTVQGAL